MRLKVWFLFAPTPDLVRLASLAGEVCDISVWSGYENDRQGVECSMSEAATAFWNEFQANLIYENETEKQKNFRESCFELGLEKCWSDLAQ